MDTLFRVEMLGRFVVRQGNRDITRFRTQKTASLLAYLALNREQTYSRDVLIEQFWPDSELRAARSNLSVALNALRRQLEPPGVPAGAVVVADYFQVYLNPIAFTTDVGDFQEAVRAAELESDTEQKVTAWMRALDCYRGDLLPTHYEDWVLVTRERLREVYRGALRQTVEACTAQNQSERAIEYAHRLIQADSLGEDSYCLLIRLLIEAGRPQDALRQYHELALLLEKELQTVPSEVTRELVAPLQDILLPQRAPLEDAGPDKQAVEAPTRTQETPRTTHHLPPQFTRFFGREEEIARLISELDPTSSTLYRLITVTGTGGTGKTRLALEVARRVRDRFTGGLWFIPLVEVDDPQRLGESLRDALELPRQSQASALEQTIAFLNSQPGPILLVLDNLEQIAAGGASVLWTLLGQAHAVWCLVTSRQPLALPGEREIPIPPLPVPDKNNKKDTALVSPGELLTYPSVALFVDRAQAARPEFQMTPRNAEIIASLCQNLEGIPLAIELAATRIRTLTPAQIRERLTKRFTLLTAQRTDKGERHRSLWGAIDWSYHLLSPELQRLFARLSVFRGGWTLEAAEAVVGGQGSEGRWSVDSGRWSSDEEEDTRIAGRLTSQHPTPNTRPLNLPDPGPLGALWAPDPASPTPNDRNVLDSLAQLRANSLLQSAESPSTLRFRMLETLREFAAEQLSLEEQEEIKRQHAFYFHQWVTGASLVGAEQTRWFSLFEEDLDNLRAALAWLERNDREMFLQLATGLARFCNVRGYMAEGSRWLENGLKHANIAPALRAQTLNALGVFAFHAGEGSTAQSYQEEGLAIWKTMGDKKGISISLIHLANIATDKNEYPLALSLYEKSLALMRELEDQRGIGLALYNMGRLALSESDFARARAYYEESLAVRQAMGDTGGVAYCFHGLGIVADNLGDYDRARTLYEESLAKYQEVGDKAGIAYVLSDLGDIARVQGDLSRAQDLYEQSLAGLREIQERFPIGVLLDNLGLLEQERGNYAKAQKFYEESLALKRELENRNGMAYSFFYMGRLAFAQGDYPRTRDLYREALIIRWSLTGFNGIADSLNGFGRLAVAEEQWERAAVLFRVADTLLDTLGIIRSAQDQEERNQELQPLRERLGEEAYTTATQGVDTMTRDQAIAYALEESGD